MFRKRVAVNPTDTSGHTPGQPIVCRPIGPTACRRERGQPVPTVSVSPATLTRGTPAYIQPAAELLADAD